MNKKILLAMTLGSFFGGAVLAETITLYPKDVYSLYIDNDQLLPFNGKSKYYSSGIDFNYTSQEYYATGELEDKLSLFSSKIKATRSSIGFINQVRVPKNYADTNGYPYSGISKIRTGISHRFDSMMENFRLDVGLIGPLSLTSQAHTSLSSVNGKSEFLAWDSQIGNELIINAYYELLSNFNVYNFGNNLSLDYISGQRLAFGNERTSLQLGGTFRIGKNTNSDFGPSDIYSGFFGGKPFVDNFYYYFYVLSRYEYIVRNIFVEGNSFDKQRHNLSRLASMSQLGFTLGYKGFRINYSISSISREYRAQSSQFFGGGGYFGTLGFDYSY